MAQEYKVLQFKVGNFQDNFGNTWCDMALEGVGEPVRIVVKDPSTIKDGDVIYGEIREHESKAGKTYQRFHKVMREQQSFTKPDRQDDAYWEDKNSAIRAQFAIKTAVEWLKSQEAGIADVENAAKMFYSMVDRVKTPEVKAEVKQEVKPESKDVDSEYASLVKTGYQTDNINLDDIPF